MGTPIMGKSIATVEQCESFIRKQNPRAPYLASIYKKYCDIYFIRLECAWVQMCLETNFLRYSNTSIVTLDMHNYAGLGAVDGNGRRQALSFSSEEEGVRSHIQHLFAYCSKEALPKGEILVDPRFKYVTRGIAPNIESMGNGNWASSKDYASNLLNLLNQLLNNNDKDFIKSVQHDLQRVSCLESGEDNATGILDVKTKAAIKQFRNIVGLPDKEIIDSQLVNALNTITQKPTLGKDWPRNVIAIKFIQWWLGMIKTGVFDDSMKNRVRDWQIKAGVWSEYGADGVIREKDWSKILK